MVSTEHNPINGLRYPALIADPRYREVRLKNRTTKYYSGTAGYADLTVQRDLAIARLAEAIAGLRPRGNVGYGSAKATHTKRLRELALVVGQDWHDAVKVAEALAAELLAYHEECRKHDQ